MRNASYILGSPTSPAFFHRFSLPHPQTQPTISSAKEEASSFRVRCPQPPETACLRTRTGEPDLKLQEAGTASTGTVSLGPELDKQAPSLAMAEKRKQAQGMAVLWPSSHSLATGTSTVPITLASLPPGLAHLHDLEAPFAAVFTHRTGAPEEPDPELGQGSAQAHVRVSPAPSRAGSGAGSSEGSRGLAFVPGTGPRANRFLIPAYSAGFLLWPGRWPTNNTSQSLISLQ